MITNDQWEKYIKKYGRLLHTISFKISGDEAISNKEDNYSDLQIAAIESIKGFSKKTGKTFDEMIDDQLFDKYTKTVLWNFKNAKGMKITKKKKNRLSGDDIRVFPLEPYSNKTGDITPISSFEPSATSSTDSICSFNSLKDEISNIGELEKSIIDLICDDPSYISGSGILKVGTVAKKLNVSDYMASKAINKIRNFLERQL